MLPGSRSPDVRHLVRSSNVEVPGLFVFKLTHSTVQKIKSCRREIIPNSAHMYFEREKFQLRGIFCDGKISSEGNETVLVVFEGSMFEVSVKAKLSKDLETIVGNFPFWGLAEQVNVYVMINGVRQNNTFTVYFAKCWERLKVVSEDNPFLITRVTSNEKERNKTHAVEINWKSSSFNRNDRTEPNVMISFHSAKKSNQLSIGRANQPDFVFECSKSIEVPNSGSATVPVAADEGFTFISVDYVLNSDALEVCRKEPKQISLRDCGKFFHYTHICSQKMAGFDTLILVSVC